MTINYKCPFHLAMAAVLVALALFACSQSGESVVGPGDKLCAESVGGVAARVSGMPQALDVCVTDAQADAQYTPGQPGRYDITAEFQQDSITIRIDVSFFAHASFPVALNLRSHANISGANDVYFSYREDNSSAGYSYASNSVAGNATLAVADPSIAVVAFRDLSLSLRDGSGLPAGTRLITEGFVNLTIDDPPIR